ncbi:hypothetical protein FKM82_026180 [Ascaphus truei]
MPGEGSGYTGTKRVQALGEVHSKVVVLWQTARGQSPINQAGNGEKCMFLRNGGSLLHGTRGFCHIVGSPDCEVFYGISYKPHREKPQSSHGPVSPARSGPGTPSVQQSVRSFHNASHRAKCMQEGPPGPQSLHSNH